MKQFRCCTVRQDLAQHGQPLENSDDLAGRDTLQTTRSCCLTLALAFGLKY